MTIAGAIYYAAESPTNRVDRHTERADRPKGAPRADTSIKGTWREGKFPLIIQMVPKGEAQTGNLLIPYNPKVSFTFASNASSDSCFAIGTNVSASTPTGVRMGEPEFSITR